MSHLPEVNQHLGVAGEGSLDLLTSRVEDLGETWMAIALPACNGVPHDLEDGAVVQLQWVTGRGLGVVTGVVRGRASLGVDVLIVDLAGEPEVIQRRRHVRADAFVRIVVTPASRAEGRQPAIGSTLDLAGGGFRARVPSWFTPGDTVRIRIFLGDEEEVAAVARVVRRIDDDVVAFEFDDMPVSARERIVRDVFRRLRQALVARDG